MRRFLIGTCASGQTPRQRSVRECARDDCEVYARLPCGGGVIVKEDTLGLAELLCAVGDAIIIATCTTAYPVRPPAPEMYMNEVETPALFSPKSLSPMSLRAVLYRRATCDKDDKLLQTLLSHGSDDELGYTIADINAWLEKHGLDSLRMVSLRYMRHQGVPIGGRTLIDDMWVACMGYHAIWVKDYDAYTRPEIDIMRFNVPELCNSSNWSYLRIPSPPVDAVPVITAIVHTRISSAGATPYMITTFPSNVFVDETNPEELVMCFLRWLRMQFSSSMKRVHLVGFLSSLYLVPLLKTFWPRQSSGWHIVGDTLVFRHRYVAVLVDAARFACRAPFRAYCEVWAGYSPQPPDEMVSQASTHNITLNAEASVDSAAALHAAFVTQQATLRSIMPACNVERFPCIGSMLLTNAALVGMCGDGVRLCFPAHPDAATFVRSSMFTDSIKTINVSSTEAPGGRMYLRSVLQHVAAGMYPVGRPYYTQTCNDTRLSIAACRVTRKSSIQIPLLYSVECPSANTFDAVLTSVDIATAKTLGGYKITVMGALEWADSRRVLKTGIDQILSAADTLGGPNVHHIIGWLSSSPDILHSQALGDSTDECLLLTAFAVSYCREKIHAAVSTMDNHFYSAHVVENSYNNVRVCPEFQHVSGELAIDNVTAILTEPL